MRRPLLALILGLLTGIAYGDGGAADSGNGSGGDQVNPPVLQKFTGSAPQTTPSFTAPDKWEVRWLSPRTVNISVLAGDGTVIAGAAGERGALFIPKGGNYHLQIDCVAFDTTPRQPPPSANTGGTSGLQNTINNGLNGNSSGTQSNNNNEATPNNRPPYGPNGAPYPYQMTLQPWEVHVVDMSSSAAKPNAVFMTDGRPYVMPTFKLPDSSALTSISGTSATGNPSAGPDVPVGKLSEDQARAVVLIKGDNAEGTGFLIKTPDGPAVITNIHVIANNPNLKITTNTGALVKMISAKGASDRDLAMLSIEDAGYSYLEMASDISKIVQPGDEVITPGNSEGGEVMLNTPGKVLGIGPERIEIDNPIYHGNSGGPVFHTKSGKVLGVVTEAMKVDMSDDLDKASFASRNSAISGSMRYFGLRLDTVSEWIAIDSRRFQIETTFLDQFHEQSRRLDSYLNASGNNRSNGNGGNDAKLYLSDEKIMKAESTFEQTASGSDTAQRIEAVRDLVFDLQCVADLNMDQIQNPGNFYPFDRERAQDEFNYRKALKAELVSIGNNVDQASRLPRTNNTEDNN